VLDDALWEGSIIKTSRAHVKDKHEGGQHEFVLQEIRKHINHGRQEVTPS
jgi:hypothetical protein